MVIEGAVYYRSGTHFASLVLSRNLVSKDFGKLDVVIVPELSTAEINRPGISIGISILDQGIVEQELQLSLAAIQHHMP